MERITESKVEQREQFPPRNLRTHAHEVIEIMTKIGGERWVNHQQLVMKEGPKSGYYPRSVQHALDLLADTTKKYHKNIVIDGDETGSVRWYVLRDGSVQFSESLNSPELVQRVRDLGFEIVP